MAQHVQTVGVTLIDLRMMPPYLAGVGSVAIARAEYVEWVRAVSRREVAFAGGQCAPGQIPLEGFLLFHTIF